MYTIIFWMVFTITVIIWFILPFTGRWNKFINQIYENNDFWYSECWKERRQHFGSFIMYIVLHYILGSLILFIFSLIFPVSLIILSLYFIHKKFIKTN